MERSLSEQDIRSTCAVLKRIQASGEVTDPDKPALNRVAKWLATHLSSFAEEQSSSPIGDLLHSQCFPLVKAFQAAYRPSTREDRERVLRIHSRKASLLGGLDLTRNGSLDESMLPNSQNPRLRELLSKVASWDEMDVFELAGLSAGRPLEYVTLAALQQLGTIDALSLPLQPLRKFLRVIEQHYLPNPYHSSTHAADVVSACMSILMADKLQQVLTHLEVLALILAAAVHDVDHPGVSNDFLIRIQDERAIVYNDISVNENHHLATAFRLLLVPGHNFMSHLSRDDFAFVRGLVVDLVLSTDMKAHHVVIERARDDLQLFGPDLTTWNSVGRTHALSLILHCADLSNTLRPYPLFMQWAKCVMAEFWEQGSRESDLGIPVSPLNNRTEADVPKSQQVFMELLVKPCFDTLVLLAPVMGARLLLNFNSNLGRYLELVRQGVKGFPEVAPRPAGAAPLLHRDEAWLRQNQNSDSA